MPKNFSPGPCQDEDLKVSLFRFVDVLPNLPDAASVVEHVQEYFEPLEGSIPELLRKGMGINPNSFTSRIVAKAIRRQVRFISQRFIVGENAQEALPMLRKIRKRGLAFTVDLVGEATVSEVEAKDYFDRYIELLEKLAEETPDWKESSPLIANHKSDKSPINISVKLSALYSQARPLASEKSIEILSERLSSIFRKAKLLGAFVYVDMEDCSLTSITLETFKRTLDQEEFKDFADAGNCPAGLSQKDCCGPGGPAGLA